MYLYTCYSNHVYLHGYCSSSIYYFINFFSLLSLVGLRFSHFLSLLSLLLFSFSLTPHSLSASTTNLEALLSSSIFSTLFFSTSVSSQPSGKWRTWHPLCRCWLRRELEEAPINLCNRSRGMGLINLCSDQPSWMSLGFGLIWVSTWSRFQLQSTMRMRNKKSTKQVNRSGFRLDGG